MNRPRLQDLAQRCGTSVSTVSRALAGKAGVNPVMRARILAAAQGTGWRGGSVTAPIGTVVLALSEHAMQDHDRNQFTWHVVEGVTTAAEAAGITIVPHPIRGAGAKGIARKLKDTNAQGLLLLTVDDPAVLDFAASAGVPAVIVNGDDPAMRLTSVAPDNRRAGEVATRHLIDKGHRDILVVEKPGRRTIRQRVEGWRDAMGAHGLRCGDDRIVRVDDWLAAEAAAAFSKFRAERGLDATAVLCVADCLAIGVLRALSEATVAVPDRMSVVGMDDLPASRFQAPPLTTIHVPAREMGEASVGLLADVAAGRFDLPRHVALACPMVERSSVTVPRTVAAAT
ncbi:MAG: LacI family DNA-binding transcriptional regulator [Inquilinaceae bacterium]